MKSARSNFEKSVRNLRLEFSNEAFEDQINRLEKHLNFVRKKQSEKIRKKLIEILVRMS